MFADFIWTVTFMFADFIWTVTLTFVVTVWTFLWMNIDEYKQEILTSKQKYLFCVQIQKESGVSSCIRVYPLHSITVVLSGWWAPTNGILVVYILGLKRITVISKRGKLKDVCNNFHCQLVIALAVPQNSLVCILCGLHYLTPRQELTRELIQTWCELSPRWAIT